MAELHSCYPSSPSDKRKYLRTTIDEIQRKWDEIPKAGTSRHQWPPGSPSPLYRTFHGEQLRDLHVSASARSPSRCFPHLFPERSLLVFQSAAVAEEMFPRLGRRPASAAAPPAFVVVSVSEPCQVRAHWRVPGLQSVEPGCQ
jgi:hypothetical protein